MSLRVCTRSMRRRPVGVGTSVGVPNVMGGGLCGVVVMVPVNQSREVVVAVLVIVDVVTVVDVEDTTTVDCPVESVVGRDPPPPPPPPVTRDGDGNGSLLDVDDQCPLPDNTPTPPPPLRLRSSTSHASNTSNTRRSGPVDCIASCDMTLFKCSSAKSLNPPRFN